MCVCVRVCVCIVGIFKKNEKQGFEAEFLLLALSYSLAKCRN